MYTDVVLVYFSFVPFALTINCWDTCLAYHLDCSLGFFFAYDIYYFSGVLELPNNVSLVLASFSTPELCTVALALPSHSFTTVDGPALDADLDPWQ